MRNRIIMVSLQRINKQMYMQIVVLDGYTANPGDLSWEALERIGELTIYDRTSPAETVERAKDAEIVLTNKVCLRRAEIGQLPKLKYIGVLATGYNVVDMEAAKEHGIVVTNVPAYSTESVAQMVFAHLLTVTNHVERYAMKNRTCSESGDEPIQTLPDGDSVKTKPNGVGKWSASPDFCYWDTALTELSGKTFGIVGLGHIGRRVADIAWAFNMKVVAFTSKKEHELPAYVEKKDLTELLGQSDVVSLHCPLVPGTRHLINRQTLQHIKPSAILINTGRGPLVNDQDVADALRAHRLRAFCADVLTEEPPRADNPLLQCEDAYITPHIAWATTEARSRLLAVAVDNVRAFVNGRPMNVVN